MWGTDQLNALKNGSREENYEPLPPFLQKVICYGNGVNGVFLVMYKALIYILLLSVAKVPVLIIA